MTECHTVDITCTQPNKQKKVIILWAYHGTTLSGFLPDQKKIDTKSKIHTTGSFRLSLPSQLVYFRSDYTLAKIKSTSHIIITHLEDLVTHGYIECHLKKITLVPFPTNLYLVRGQNYKLISLGPSQRVSVQGTVDLRSYILPINRYSHML